MQRSQENSCRGLCAKGLNLGCQGAIRPLVKTRARKAQEDVSQSAGEATHLVPRHTLAVNPIYPFLSPYLVSQERRIHAQRVRKFVGQNDGIFDCHARALSHARWRCVCSVSHEHDPVPAPAVQLEAHQLSIVNLRLRAQL